MSVEIAPQLDLKKVELSHPDYKLTKLSPQQAIPTAPNTIISTAGGNESTFLLFPGAMNLSKSVLHFTITPVAAGGTDVNYLYMDALTCFRQIQLYDQQSTLLCDIQDIAPYTKVVWMSETPKDEFDNYDTAYGGVGSGRFLRKSNGNAAAAVADEAIGTYTRRPTGDDVQASISYDEKAYIIYGGANTATPILDVSIPLSALYNTIFSVDKDMYFPQSLTLRLVWNSAGNVGFSSDAVHAPLTGAAALVSADVQNLALYVCQEKNQMIVNQLKEKVMTSGLSFPIPYVYSYRTLSAQTAQQGSSIKLSAGNGQKLLKIYHTILPSAPAAYAVYNNSRTSTTLVNYYSQINGDRLTQFNVALASHEDWLLIQEKLQGSITLNENIYRYNWFWCDDFTGQEKLAIKKPLDDNEIKGLPLTEGEVRYDFVAQCDATVYMHMDFAITQKMLNITAQGIIIV